VAYGSGNENACLSNHQDCNIHASLTTLSSASNHSTPTANMDPTANVFQYVPMEQPVPQYILQATNGQAVEPPVAEGISAGKLFALLLKQYLTASR
jgi:hypothetical protein